MSFTAEGDFVSQLFLAGLRGHGVVRVRPGAEFAVVRSHPDYSEMSELLSSDRFRCIFQSPGRPMTHDILHIIKYL